MNMKGLTMDLTTSIKKYLNIFNELPPFGEGLTIKLLKESIDKKKKIVKKSIRILGIDDYPYELEK